MNPQNTEYWECAACGEKVLQDKKDPETLNCPNCGQMLRRLES